MSFQRVHQSSAKNLPTSESRSQFAPHTFTVQRKQGSETDSTPEEIENQAFEQNKFEARKLEAKQNYSPLTPVEQERLGVLQAKMSDFQEQSLAKKSGFAYNFADIPVHSPSTLLSKPIQPKLAQNTTGLPDSLKVGIESLSGISMHDVKVHYNSDKPAQLQALAYTQGTDIHLEAGQQKHLPHESWHIVQQKQGRVSPRIQMQGKVINDDAVLEEEADVMGNKALSQSTTLNNLNHKFSPAATNIPQSSPQEISSVIQYLKVTDDDIGKKFQVKATDGHIYDDAELTEIKKGGYYYFTTDDDESITVRGQNNIISRVDEDMEMSDLDDDEDEFNIDDIATEKDVVPKVVLGAVKDSFARNPRTLRIHSQFGSKTVSKGQNAYSDPQETIMAPQAMVDHRKGDFKYSGSRIGKDYKDWGDELSDSENDERAQNMLDYLEGEEDLDDNLFTPRQKAAGAAMMLTTHISEPLRTDASSERAVERGRAGFRAIARGNEGFGTIFGDKDNARYYPARSKGAARERSHYRGSRSPSPGETDLDDLLL